MHPGFQKYVWANGAGDGWFKRNKHELGKRDLTEDVIKTLEIEPKNVLEVGCCNGWRLEKLAHRYNCEVKGIDPSEQAAIAAGAKGVEVRIGTADKLPYFDNSFDMVIFGFCLCFISPEDWPAIVAESTRVLKDSGYLIIYDFIGTSFRDVYCAAQEHGPASY